MTAASVQQGPIADGPTAPLPSRRILYVEDNLVNQVLMTEVVGRHTPHQLQLADNVRQGLELAAQQRFDLLLLDLRLPDGDGVSLLGKLRRLATCAAAPAVAVTAEYGFRLEGSGFCEVWYKPLDLNQTLARLDRLLRGPAPTPPAGLLATARQWRLPALAAPGLASA
jgi:CheY-like chemotaxis protein